MNYKYLVAITKLEDLKEQLKFYGSQGWDLITIILLQTIRPGATLSGQPNIELQYQLFFKKPDHGQEN